MTRQVLRVGGAQRKSRSTRPRCSRQVSGRTASQAEEPAVHGDAATLEVLGDPVQHPHPALRPDPSPRADPDPCDRDVPGEPEVAAVAGAVGGWHVDRADPQRAEPLDSPRRRDRQHVQQAMPMGRHQLPEDPGAMPLAKLPRVRGVPQRDRPPLPRVVDHDPEAAAHRGDEAGDPPIDGVFIQPPDEPRRAVALATPRSPQDRHHPPEVRPAGHDGIVF
jgi:hypothetical protein